MTRERLEKKYGIKIVKTYYYDFLRNRYTYEYTMYSADGCKWENGLRTLASVEKECKTWEHTLLEIKRIVSVRRERV